jgi:murein DD-endopeptidase MepM/ murein hydrolase activator NlpD
MVEKRWLGRKFHRYGAVLAVRFNGAMRRCAYYRYKPEGGDAGFFDADGKPMKRAVLRSPVAFFGVDPEARGMLPPSVEVVEGNIGAAYRLPEGAPVVALGDATVRNVDTTAEEGNFVDLELSDGVVARYCHLSRVLGELEPGAKVEQGEIIGLAGHSGRTPHDRLRLELWVEDDGTMRTIDPLRRINDGVERAHTVGAPIPDDQLDRFRDDTEPQQTALRLVR